MLFSPAMREATKAVGVDVSRGYYMVHGSSDDAETNAFDDDHQNDVLYILVHTAQAQQYAHIYSAGMNFCALWDVFWHKQMERLPLGDRTPQVWQLASTHIKLKVSTGSDANRSFLDWAKKEKLFFAIRFEPAPSIYFVNRSWARYLCNTRSRWRNKLGKIN